MLVAAGGWLAREAYREYLDPVTGNPEKFCSLIGNRRHNLNCSN